MRFRLSALALGLFAAATLAQSPSGVVINEFQYDDSGTDDREFVELYNGSAVPVDISGWTLFAADATWPADNNPDYVIPANTILGAGQFYVLGAPLVPNVNQIVVNGATSTNLWENDNETLTLTDTLGFVHDTLAYEANKNGAVTFPTQFAEGVGIYGNMSSQDFSPQSWSRWFDGYDTNNNGRDFGLRLATPGASNNTANLLTFFDNFDATPTLTPVAGWSGSFRHPMVIDPTLPDINNPSSIPASPNGGNCMIMWDITGGGNSAILESAATDNMLLECYVYIRQAPALVCPDFETWAIGVRGTCETFHNHPNPIASLAPCANTTVTDTNGNTGVSWFYQVDLLGNALLILVDENSGGNTERVLGQIAITPGVNDGWQRLRLQVAGDVVVANFGGTYGNPNDGVRIQALLQDGVQFGTAYMSYREFIVNNSNARPITIDDLVVTTTPVPYTVFMVQPAAGQIRVETAASPPAPTSTTSSASSRARAAPAPVPTSASARSTRSSNSCRKCCSRSARSPSIPSRSPTPTRRRPIAA